uniref:Uncharacterized protein n=1 Tax=Panagrolaimus sp. JU765 TaxID=591449 RepID=A0AC34R7H4_9BILA
KIKSVEELRKTALETLQICGRVHGISLSEFKKSRVETQPVQLEDYLHLANFQTVRELYEKWFGDMIAFDGDIMRITDIKKLANGNEYIFHNLDLQARTKEKPKKRKSKRPMNAPVRPVYPSRRQATTTHSEAQLPEVRDFPSPYYSHSPSPALPHSNSMPPIYPEFDNQ